MKLIELCKIPKTVLTKGIAKWTYFLYSPTVQGSLAKKGGVWGFM